MKTRQRLTSLLTVVSLGILLVLSPVLANEPGSVKWFFVTSMEPLSGVPGSPALAEDGTIYAGSLNGMFYAINPDGTEKWSFDAGSPIAASPVIADDGTIYVDAIWRIFAFTPNGGLKWIFEADCALLGEMAVAKDGTIYVGTNSSKLYAITSAGAQKWTFPVPEGLNTYDPVIDRNGIIYFGTGSSGTKTHYFYALYPDGTKKWDWPYNSYYGMTGAPAIGNTGLIYVPLYTFYTLGNYENLYAFRPDGSVAWVYETTTGVQQSACVDSDGIIYAPSGHDSYCALYPADGSEKWKKPVNYQGSPNSPGAIGENGIVYYGSLDSYIYALDASDGSVVWTRGTEDQVHSSPVISEDGIMYIGCGHSIKAIYTDSYGHATSVWPMHRANSKRNARVDKFFISIHNLKLIIQQLRHMRLHGGIEKSLTGKLTSAVQALEREQSQPAANKLNAFIQEVSAQEGKKIPTENARFLRVEIGEIRDAVLSRSM